MKPKKPGSARQRSPARKPRQPGRPSIFTQALADEICRRLSEGESLRSISRDPGMPAWSTMMEWVRKRPEFSDQYAHARGMGCEYLADEIIDIADDSTNDFIERQTRAGPQKVHNREHVERSRLRVDSRKWLLSKLLPRKYGNRLGVEAGGRDGGPIGVSVESRNELIDSILALIHPKPDPESEPRRDGKRR